MVVRNAELRDAAAVALLSGELGYAVDRFAMEQRLKQLIAQRHQAIYVACSGAGDVVAWIQVDLLSHLTTGRTAVIAGLVVSPAMRNRGIGALLVAQAETWAKEQHADRMLVRSRLTRPDSHRFYEREGFKIIKTSLVFEKPVPNES